MPKGGYKKEGYIFMKLILINKMKGKIKTLLFLNQNYRYRRRIININLIYHFYISKVHDKIQNLVIQATIPLIIRPLHHKR